MQCKFTKKDKNQCKAHAISNSDFCFRHDPKSVKKALKASKSGGANRSKSVSFNEEIKLKNSKDIQRFLGKIINGVWNGQVPVKTASSLGFLTRCWLDAHDKSDIEKRLDDFEDRLMKVEPKAV